LETSSRNPGRRDTAEPADLPDERPPSGGWGLFLVTGLVTFCLGLLLIAVFGITLALIGARSGEGVGRIIDAITRDLPTPEAAVSRDVFKSSFIYDRNGEILYEIFDPNGGRRTVIPISEIPQHLVAATLATEDANFYQNPGFDLRAMMRAVWQNFRGQSVLSGASTITQQLVKNALFDPEERVEQSFERKAKEIVLAYKLSQMYSKDQILERYLNEINYGNLAYGIEAAARTYFDKPARSLDLAEASLLAGLPQLPSAYNPFVNLRAAKERQAEVLGLMVRQGYISEQIAEAALRQELKFARLRKDIEAPHFVMYVRDILERRYGVARLYSGGFRVFTTLDLNAQRAAEEVARSHVARIREHDVGNAAIVAINPISGEVLAMVGSVDYFDSAIAGQVNMANSLRQPGSTLKPFTYAAAIARGTHSPGTIIRDEPTTFRGAAGEPYVPQNPDGRFRGPVTLRHALANSLNIPALKLVSEVTPEAMIDLARRMGITSLGDARQYGLTVTLGSGEVRLLDLTYAYTPFANGGFQIGQPVIDARPGSREFEPAVILKVVDAEGRVLDEYSPRPGKRVISPQVAWIISDILSDDEARSDTYGRNSPLAIGRPAAVKTGTTDRYHDSWTIGYTPDLVVGVWVGNADNQPMRQVLGVSGAGAIWNGTMQQLLKNTASRAFIRPAGLVQVAIDPRTGLRPAANGPSRLEWFLEGNVPTQWTEILRPHTPTVTAARPAPPAPTATPRPTPPVAPPVEPSPISADANIAIVPSVVGMPEAAARRAIEQAGLNNTYTNYQSAADVTDQAYFARFTAGQVVSQTPQPGGRVPRGTTIYIAVKRG